MLRAIHQYFAPEPTAFEPCAAAIVEMMDSRIIVEEITRGSRDGGRDALGSLIVGPEGDSVALEVAIEAAQCRCR